MSRYGSPEEYSRFLRKDFIKDSGSRISANAFMPSINSTNNRKEVSCFETQFLNVDEIYHIAVENQISPNQKAPIGYCTIDENDFPYDKVKIDKNYYTERHIDIIGWEIYESKEKMKLVAIEIAELSSKKIQIFTNE